MELIVGILIGAGGIAATLYVAFRSISIANQQNAETVRLLVDARSALATVEERTRVTQESLLRERLDQAEAEGSRQLERAIRRSATELQLADNQIERLTQAARGALADTIERVSEPPTVPEHMQSIDIGEVPPDVLDEIRDLSGLPTAPTVVAAWRRGGRGAPRWLVQTDGAGNWEATRTVHGLRVYARE